MWNMTLRVCSNKSIFLLFSLSRELSPFLLHEHVLSLLVSKLFILSLHSLYKFHVSCFVFSHFNSLPPASLSLLLHFNCDFHDCLTRSRLTCIKCLKRQSTDSNKSVVGEPTTTTTVMAVNKNQTLLEINAVIAVMLDSIWSYFSAPSYMKGIFAGSIIRFLLHDDFPWPHLPHACLQRIYMGFLCAYIWAFVRKWSYTWE